MHQDDGALRFRDQLGHSRIAFERAYVIDDGRTSSIAARATAALRVSIDIRHLKPALETIQHRNDPLQFDLDGNLLGTAGPAGFTAYVDDRRTGGFHLEGMIQCAPGIEISAAVGK